MPEALEVSEDEQKWVLTKHGHKVLDTSEDLQGAHDLLWKGLPIPDKEEKLATLREAQKRAQKALDGIKLIIKHIEERKDG